MAKQGEQVGAAPLVGGVETTLHSHVAPKLSDCAAPDAAVNFNQQQATSLVIENRTDDPGTPVDGQIWLRTDL